jgi:D-alanyl-D-alanine carboxypeptidase
VQYGLGLASLQRPCGGRLWGHDGTLAGYQTWALATSSGDDQVVMMVNASTGENATIVLVLQQVFKALCAIKGTPS